MWPRLHSKTLHKPSGRHTPGFAKRPIWTNWELNSATPQNTEWTITFWAYCKEKKSYPCRATISLSKTLFYNRSGTSKVSFKGLSPILAHPERYAYYYDDKKIYKELHEQGCEFQVNLLSLAGYYNKRAKEVAEWLISKQMVDYLGSDLHNSSHVLHINKYLSGKEYPKHMRNIHIKNNHL